MDVKHMAWCRGTLLSCLLLIFLPVGYFEPSIRSDDMEDAFAGETLTDGTCKRNINDKLIFCRYRAEEKDSLSTLNPCLCTHILFPIDLNVPKIEILKSLKNKNADLMLLASVSTAAMDHLNVSSASQGFLLGSSNSSADGIDVQIKRAAYLDEASSSKLLTSIQSFTSKLKTEAKFKTFSLTITGNASSLLNDSQFQKIWSNIDFLTFDPSIASHGSEKPSDAHLDLTQMVDLVLARGFPRSKLLFPISLRRSLEQIMNESFVDGMYPKVCDYINENKNSSIQQKNGENSNPADAFENQVKFAVNKDMGGIDIWSLNDDDVSNTCGKNPYPIINEISNNIKGAKDLFGSFTDLDITLSTGESQISEEIQVLHEQNTDPEEMRKFKCERIGFYRHPTDCTKFYHCADYRTTTAQPVNQHAIFVYKCPRGLVYDERQGSCNWPSYSEPCEGSDELMPVPPKKFKCTTPGFHADPMDCRWFYYCSDLGDGQLAAFQFLCPADHLGFDEKNLLCNWKWMVPICGVKRQDSDHSTTEQSDKELRPRIRNRLSKELQLGDLQPESLPISVISVTNPSKETGRILINSRESNQTRTNSFRRDQLESKASSTTDIDDMLKRWAVSFVNYTDIRVPNPGTQDPKVVNETNTNEYVDANAKGKTEKKYGTAYWHRSMANSRPRHRIPSYAFDVPIGNRRTSVVEYDDDLNFEGRHQRENIREELKHGIGRVKKLNSRPEEIRGLSGETQGLSIEREIPPNFAQNPTPSNYNKPFLKAELNSDSLSNDKINHPEIVRGRSLGENVVTNYQFDDIKDLRKTPPNTNSFARVKCSKIIAVNDPGTSNENVFGCTSEVSLFVRMKEGNEFSKYVLKDDKLSNSAHQESKQVKYLENDPGITKNFKSRSLQLEDVVEQTSKQTNEHKNQSNFTQGRSLANSYSSEPSHQIIYPLKLQSTNQKRHIGDQMQNLPLIHFDSEIKSSDKDVLNKSDEESILSKNDLQNLHQQDSQREKETTSKSNKNNFMPISFYPQGVLLNVDLNHISEIPPQILLEVDIMLKKFMTDGDIDLNLLTKKLNATMEHMPEAEMKVSMTSSKVDSMLNVLENILNTTDSTIPQKEMNSTEITTVEIRSSTEYSSTSDSHVNSTLDDLAYENITNSFSTISDNGTTHGTDISTSTLNAKSSSTNTPVRKSEKSVQTEEVTVKEVPDNIPFVRRRLFRKYRYPSIREQLEIQKLLTSLSSSTEHPISQKTTAAPVTSNRRRFPSIRDQLLWNNNNVAFDDSIGFLFNERDKIQSPTVALNSQDGHSVSNTNENFGNRVRSTSNDARFQTNNRWVSQPSIDEPDYRNSNARLPENKMLPNSDSSKHFQDRNSNYDKNRGAFLPTNAENDDRNSGVRLPENAPPPASRANSHFQDLNLRHDGNRRVSFPTNDDNDYRNSGVRVAENAAPPATSANSPFQDHNLRHDGNRRESFPTNDENDYRNSGARLPGNVPPPTSSANSHFQDHNLRHDGNRRESFPTNNENDYRNSGVRLPGSAPPPASSANSHFQDPSLKHDGNRREFFPTNNENDYRNSGVRLPENAPPPGSRGNSHFQDLNLRHDGNRRVSFPTNNENDYRNSGVRLLGNAPPPASSANSHFQDHNLKHDGNRRESFPTNNENDYRNSGVRLPENRIRTNSDTGREFQIYNSRSDSSRRAHLPVNDEPDLRYPEAKLPDRGTITPSSNTGAHFQAPDSRIGNDKWTTLPDFEERDYGNRVRLPKNRESPNFSRGTQLRNHNARSNNLSPNLQSKEASTSHSPTNQGKSLQRRLQNPSRNASRFQYTLPLPPVQYSTENSPVTKQDIPVSESNYFNQYENRYPNEDNFEVQRRNSSRTTQRRRKSRKLKILVKKLPNQGRNDENGSLPQTNIQIDSGMKIPKKLLNELKTNLIKKLSANGKSDVELEIQFQDHVWNIPFVNNQSSVDISPVACTRAGLFQHPKDCNMFYECFWDKWLKRFTLHVFSCPVRLIYDENIRGCTRPSFESPCQNSV